ARNASMSACEDAAAGCWSARGAGAGGLSERSLAMGTLLPVRIRAAHKVAAPRAPRNGYPSVRGPGLSVAEGVVHLERERQRRRPFGARCGAAAAALVDRQLERLEQRLDLLLRRDVRHAGPRAERRLIEAVEGGQAAREKLAIDDALGETVDES